MNTEKVAELVFTLPSKDLNKAELVKVLKRVFLSNRKETDITDKQLAVIYKFCSPRIKTNPLNDFEWVAKAVDPNEVREYLRFVYSDGEFIYGSNGHLIHKAKSKDFNAGFYTIHGDKIKGNYKYPDIDGVIPNKLPETCGYSDMVLSHIRSNSKNPSEIYSPPGWKEEGKGVNRRYFENATNYFIKDKITIEYSKEDSLIKLLVGEDYIAVLMAIKL